MTLGVVFSVTGPMVSWGTENAGNVVRDTASRPTKSAIMGLVAASMGIRRAEPARLEALAEDLSMACLTLAEGETLTDLHTVAAGKLPAQCATPRTRREQLETMERGGILTRRHYRTSAFYVMALTGADRLVEEVRTALRYPKFQPALGRKSCMPSLPMAPVLVPATHLLQGMREVAAIHLNTPELAPMFRRGAAVVATWEHEVLPLIASQVITRRDYPDGRRGFGQRRESSAFVTIQP